MLKICQQCGKEFSAKTARRKCCSHKCGWQHKAIHSQCNTPEYVSWRHMKQRCTNPKRLEYKHYGARGIKVCDRWQLFANFIEDMGLRPTIKHTLERNDNNGDYEPGNCRWATRLEQSRNREFAYSAEQDRIIREGIERGMNFVQIAPLLGKKPHAIASRAYRIGLKSGQPMRVSR